jgi:hypothetical protein
MRCFALLTTDRLRSVCRTTMSCNGFPPGWFMEQKEEKVLATVAELLLSFKGLGFSTATAAPYEDFFGPLHAPKVAATGDTSTLDREGSGRFQRATPSAATPASPGRSTSAGGPSATPAPAALNQSTGSTLARGHSQLGSNAMSASGGSAVSSASSSSSHHVNASLSSSGSHGSASTTPNTSANNLLSPGVQRRGNVGAVASPAGTTNAPTSTPPSSSNPMRSLSPGRPPRAAPVLDSTASTPSLSSMTTATSLSHATSTTMLTPPTLTREASAPVGAAAAVMQAASTAAAASLNRSRTGAVIATPTSHVSMSSQRPMPSLTRVQTPNTNVVPTATPGLTLATSPTLANTKPLVSVDSSISFVTPPGDQQRTEKKPMHTSH